MDIDVGEMEVIESLLDQYLSFAIAYEMSNTISPETYERERWMRDHTRTALLERIARFVKTRPTEELVWPKLQLPAEQL